MEKRIAIALGDFDGMHLAHQKVITGAENSIIYCVNNRFTLLQKSIFERRFKNAVFADFNKLRDMSAEEFINNILIDGFGAGMLLCGYNFRFGKGANWTALDLRRYLESKDVWVRILEHLDFEGEPISSSRIRECIKNGEIEKANKMLGYNFTFENEVISGDSRGRKLGFPTVNQKYPEGMCDIKFGVYESRAEIDGKMYKAMSNIGIRPSFKVDYPLSETHIIGFNGDLYGKTLRLELVRYIRQEKKFDSFDKLKEQLINDKSSII